MEVEKIGRFNWDELLKRIEHKNVIPVIGHGLYRIATYPDEKNGMLLYDYLAQQLVKAGNISLGTNEGHKFARVCFAYLRANNNNILLLSDFLKEKLLDKRLIPNNPLLKLACIKNFSIFITTAYDNFLTNILKTVRRAPIQALGYSYKEKYLSQLDNELFNGLKNSERSLVYQVLGNIETHLEPAYTEENIQETVVSLQQDMKANPGNNLFRTLNENSLLFMGCSYEDWLFRFFIRTVSNKPIDNSRVYSHAKTFICDNFTSFTQNQLERFIETFGAEMVWHGDSSDFVDELFERIEREAPSAIVQPQEFSSTVFISFDGNDREAARTLVNHLRNDGINVWWDEHNLKTGDMVDDVISRAIDNCKAFVPLISKNSQQTRSLDARLKYHLREWEWAYSRANNMGVRYFIHHRWIPRR
jgi:hypothetical protein